MIKAIKISGSIILMSLLPCIQACYVVDDDDLNAICNADCTTVQGKATTEFGNPVENVSLELYWYSLSGLAVGKARKIIAASFTPSARSVVKCKRSSFRLRRKSFSSPGS